jgi:hypothetical protein
MSIYSCHNSDVSHFYRRCLFLRWTSELPSYIREKEHSFVLKVLSLFVYGSDNTNYSERFYKTCNINTVVSVSMCVPICTD